VPADIDTKWLIDHIDAKFEASDSKRQAGLDAVHDQIAEQGKQITRIGTNLDNHIAATNAKFVAIETRESRAGERKDTWLRTGATGLLGGGSLWAFLEWIRSGHR